MVVLAYNPNTGKAKIGGFQVQSQPKTLPQIKNNNNKEVVEPLRSGA
jgi:hypothetical protein